MDKTLPTWRDVFGRPQDFPQKHFELVVPFPLEVFYFKDDREGHKGLAFMVGWGMPVVTGGKSCGRFYALWLPANLDVVFPLCAVYERDADRWDLWEDFSVPSRVWIVEWLQKYSREMVAGILNAWRAEKAGR